MDFISGVNSEQFGSGWLEHRLEKYFEGHIWEEFCDLSFMSAKGLEYLLPVSWK